MFTLTINTDNAAFEYGEGAEVARILRETAALILATRAASGKLRDANGNTVGEFRYSDD